MLVGNIRNDLHPTCRTSRSTSHLIPTMTINDSNSFPSSPSTTTTTTTNNNNQNPMISQQTMMDYARMSYRYTTVCDCLMTKFEIRIVFFVRR